MPSPTGTRSHRADVYEESEADLQTERNNNDIYRSTKSRSPDYSYERKGSKGDRRSSSGYLKPNAFNYTLLCHLFVQIIYFCFLLFYILWLYLHSRHVWTDHHPPHARHHLLPSILATFVCFVHDLIVAICFRFFMFVINRVWFGAGQTDCTFSLDGILICDVDCTLQCMLKHFFPAIWWHAFCMFLFGSYLACKIFARLRANKTHACCTYTRLIPMDLVWLDGSTNSDLYIEATGRRRSSGKVIAILW